MSKSYDAFMSHASEDKEKFVKPLFNALEDRGCCIWYDQFQIDYGDFFETRIYEGIHNSRFALFVITPNLIQRPTNSWVWREFSRILEKEEILRTNVLIPVFYDVTIQEFQQYIGNNPTLNTITERHSFKTLVDGGIYGVAKKLSKLFGRR